MSAPVIHHFQNRCLRRFHDAGATDATSARPLAEMGISDSLVFRYLRFRGIVCEAEPGEYPGRIRWLAALWHGIQKLIATLDAPATEAR